MDGSLKICRNETLKPTNPISRHNDNPLSASYTSPVYLKELEVPSFRQVLFI
ncbi:hypothetical protein PAECIP111894_03581 [Paenibacillus pseudetheri]|uniref:Uncharacterized protein n=1 Tax=Paenibacillus pseudetheri TaxID=2897682 RepID=A0ABM9BEN2_9BACL|nr:hypothetical protein PAECIP111894_03581 [Paenibacillus pseudetheri]